MNNQIVFIKKVHELLASVGLLLIATIFVMYGLNKIDKYGNIAGWMESLDVPGRLLPLVRFLLVVGGIALIIRYKTKILTFALAGFCALSTVIFHSNFAAQYEIIHFMKNLVVTGGFIFLVVI